MHFSRMCTTHLLSISQHALHREGCASQHALGRGCVYPSMHCTGGVSQHALGVSAQGQRGCLPWGVCPGGSALRVADTPCGL